MHFLYTCILEMNGDSPKGSNVKGVISYQRRRLTVISDSKFADGFNKKLSILDDDPEEHIITQNAVRTTASFASWCWPSASASFTLHATLCGVKFYA